MERVLQICRGSVPSKLKGLIKQCIRRRHVWTRRVIHRANLDFLRMRGKDNVKWEFILI
jgi:hypothetical protein